MTTTTVPPEWQAPSATGETGEGNRVLQAVRKISAVLGMRPAGWIVFGLAALLGVSGLAMGWYELTLAGIFCLFVGAIAVLFTIGRPRYAVRLSLDAPHVVVGQEAGGSIEVINRARRGSMPSRMDVPVSARRASFAVPWLSSGKGFRDEFRIPTDRRAVVTVGPAQSVQGDPFGLTGRGARWTEELELYVHPITVRLPGRQSGFIRDIEGHPTSRLTNSDISFHALREYAPGDDRRHVHWRSSARIGRLMVRQFEETRQSRVCVAIDVARSSYTTEDEFEKAVSVGASVVLQSFREDNPLGLVTSAEIVPVISPLRTLDEMCRIEASPRASAADVIQVVLDHEPNASVVVWVTGGNVPVMAVQKASTKFEADVKVVAIRVDELAELSVRTIANVTVIQLADLADLPRAIRRASQ